MNNIFELIKALPPRPFSMYVNNLSQVSITGGQNTFSYMFSDGFVFKQYKSLEDAYGLIQDLRSKGSIPRYAQSALTFVAGSDFTNLNSFLNSVNTNTPSFKKIKKTTGKIVENLEAIVNLGGLYKNDRIKITEDKRGVFDFSLASQGLFRPVEFFSQDLKDYIKKSGIKNPFFYLESPDGVADPEKVNLTIVGTSRIYSVSVDSRSFTCIRRQKGATKVFETYPDKCFLQKNSDGIEITYDTANPSKVFNGLNNVKLKYASSNKKSYLLYQKKKDSVKHVDIFFPVNFLTMGDGNRALYLMPAYLIASTIEKYGIQVRISAVRVGSDGNINTAISVPVKDYNESCQLSFDRIYNLLGKRSSAQTFFAFLKVMAQNEGVQRPAQGITDAQFGNVEYYNPVYMNFMMQVYKNWIKKNRNEPFVNTKVVNENFQFAMATTGYNVLGDNIEYQDLLDGIHEVFFKYFYYLDYLAIEMLDMREFIMQLYTRMIENEFFRTVFTIPSTKVELKNVIRSYVVSMLVEKYSLVTAGEYSDTPEQESEKKKKFAQKVEEMNNEINSI